MKSFLTGLGIGATLGCAFAPAAGRETRKRMKQVAQRLAERSQSLSQSSDVKAEQETHQLKESTPRVQNSRLEEAQSAQAQSSIADEVAQILNTASKTMLRSVRGIGDATARRIIEHRPYDSEDAVLKEKVLSKDTLEELKETLVEKDEEVA